MITDKAQLEFIEDETERGSVFELRRNTSQFYAGRFCLFTCTSQHVYGDTLAECVEKAIAAGRSASPVVSNQ